MGMKNDEIVCLNCSLRVCVCEIYYSAATAPAAAVYGNKTTLLRDSSTQHHAVQSTAIIIRPNIYIRIHPGLSVSHGERRVPRNQNSTRLFLLPPPAAAE